MPLWIALNFNALHNERLPSDLSPLVMRTTVVISAAVMTAVALIDVPRELRAAAVSNRALLRDEAEST